ncbi:phage tail protein [Selenomonadales bacterium OttesenSCG-928-I06]|nr:phage tail protein [Selenomonadales bacterium OttesenSCG-928-I06]
MGQIGSLGEIVFEVSGEKIQTFKDMKRSSSARVATHEILGQKPMLEFIGPGLEDITFNIKLSQSLGVDIDDSLEKLRSMRDEGKIEFFIVAGEPVTDNKWLVLSLSEATNYTDGTGKALSVDVDVALKEYVEDQEVM